MDTFTPFQHILLEHAGRYPWWVASDVYKLAYQAAMGSGHGVINREQVRARLEEELSRLAEGPDEPLLDPIAPGGEMLRVHLRPFLKRGLPADRLLEAFLDTAGKFKGEERVLKAYIIQAVELADHKLIHVRLRDFTSFLGLMSSAGFPPVHHSEEFRREYRPAYRVVSRQFLPREWLKK